MKPRVLFFAMAALAPTAVAPALAQGDAGTPPLTTNSNTNAPLPQVLKVTPSAQPGTLSVGKGRFHPGQPVPITFQVVNTSGKSITYNFPTGQRFDITVSDAQGAEVWNWAHGRLFTQNLGSVSLAPGKSLAYTASWPGIDHTGRPVAPGTYTVSAKLTSNNRPAITGGFVVNTDRDPNNMGAPTRTPADSGAIRQVNPAPQVTAKATVTIR